MECLHLIKEERNGLTLIETPFGICVVGPVPKGDQVNYMSGIIHSNHVTLEYDDIKYENEFKFVEAEMAGISKECPCLTKTDDELKFEKLMETSWSKDEDGRLQVQLSWKVDPNTLENNRIQAINRDIKIRQQMAKKLGVMKLFAEQINEMIKGVLHRVDAHYPKRYLPLLAIVNLGRESTKVRICLDAKSTYKGVSLNDVLLKGKLEMNDIFQVLSRFRSGKNALVGDIRKMFWQIKLDPEDRKFHGVIWNGETFVFTRVCFGDKNSPPIADYCMKLIAYEGRISHPKASEILMNKRYMDDIGDANQSEQELRCTRDEINQLLGTFGFKIKEWFSNNPSVGTVMDKIKVLGLNWHPERDTLSVITKDLSVEFRNFTKRTVLSTIASLWDPLGLCAAFIVKGRLIFQSIVRLKGGWDEQIRDEELMIKWERWRSQIAECKDIILGRDLFPSRPLPNCKFIGFSDGSSVGFGCVIYLRWSNDDESEIDVKFMAAKGKVGPINGNTVPRMELCGALMLARLTHSTEKAIQITEISDMVGSTILCTDSSIVLSWVNSEAIKYRPYVKNKIIEIQDLQPAKVWRYIPTYKNKSADLISKGCDTKDLDIIINGPDILKLPVDNWPSNTKNATKKENEELLVSRISIICKEDLLDINYYNDWQRLLRVTAYVRRVFCKRLREDNNVMGELVNPDPEEIRRAKHYWIRQAQKR